MHGGRVVLARVPDPDKVLPLVGAGGVTATAAVPTAAQRWVDAVVSGRHPAPPALRLLKVGGGPPRPRVDLRYRLRPTDWMRVIFNPSFIWRWPHMLAAVLISAGFFIAGISAWYLKKGRVKSFARRSMSLALGIAALLMPVEVYVGDNVVGHEVAHQLPKLAAIEGNWNNGNSSYVLFAIPDQEAARNIVELDIPCLGSAIAKDLTCKKAAPGLKIVPPAVRPDMAATFWGFRVMFLAALLMFGTVFAATVLRIRKRLWTASRFHTFVLWTTPVGILATLGGWVAAESGRQPWIVFGLLRTSAAVSHLASGEVLFSVFGFSALYLFMLVAYIVYIVRTMRIGPERDDPRRELSAGPEGTGSARVTEASGPTKRPRLHDSRESAARRGAVATAVAGVLLVAVLLTVDSTAAPLNLNTPGRAFAFGGLLLFAAVAGATSLITFRWKQRSGAADTLPLAGLVVAMVSVLLALVVARYPVIVPPGITVDNTVSPHGAMVFILVGIGLNMPLVLAYNVFAHRSFAGELHTAHHTDEPPAEGLVVTGAQA